MTTDASADAGAAKSRAGSDTVLGRPAAGWRRRLYEIVFESDTPAGRRFDVLLILLILLSVLAVLADSVRAVNARYRTPLDALEWLFTLAFSIEYLARLLSVERPLRYALSFFGMVDLAAVLPTYLAVLFPEAQLLIDVRVLRLLRVFRIFKLTAYVSEYQLLGSALAASRRKILVFLSVVIMLVLIVATLMYVIEGAVNGFTSIPTAIYWAISTMTTVGYGDISPHTALGRALASIIMLLGWGILAVPTGIVTAEMTAQHLGRRRPRRRCDACGRDDLDGDAAYCQSCGARLTDPR